MKVFLSYSHNEQSFASDLSRALSACGISVWRDVEQLDLGGLIPTAISTALSECDAYCVVISKQSMSSKWVNAELSAAFMRWTHEPSFKIIPLVIEQDSVPELLSGMYYLDTKSLTVPEISIRVFRELSGNNRALSAGMREWSSLLSAIERDQFSEPGSHQFGGWSKAYSASYLPLAFPDQVPDSVATVDSITVTYWMIRGLCSLKKFILRTPDQDRLLNRIDLALSRGRSYLVKHFNGRSAGLIRRGAEGDGIRPDVRHSVAFAKALLLLGPGSEESIRNALEFAIVNLELGDHRLPTFAEVYHSIGLLNSYPRLRSTLTTDVLLDRRRAELEQNLLDSFQRLEDVGSSPGLLGHSNQWHMAPYYSWWVLDACGQLMLESSDHRVRELVRDVLMGLDSLRITNSDGSAGYPITLGGYCDVGASALIGELLLRLSPKDHGDAAPLVASFLLTRISDVSLSKYAHQELLWAVPQFFERYVSLDEGQMNSSYGVGKTPE